MQPRYHFSKLTLLLICSLLLHGCSTLPHNFTEPDVEIIAIQPNPTARAGELSFRIKLRVFNPNEVALPLTGVYYTLSLADEKVITGTANDLPEVPAYGQADVTLTATASLLGSMMAATKLMSLGGNNVPYTLDARLGLRNTFVPYVNVSKSGEIKLAPTR